jgi:membrane protein
MAKKRSSRFKTLLERAEAFIDDRKLALAGEARLGRLQKFVHFWILVGRSFVRNRCPVRASALAYTTLLALIPLLAVGLGVSTGILKGSEQQTAQLIRNIVDQVAPQLDLLPIGSDEKADATRAVVDMFPLILQSEGAEQAKHISELVDRIVPKAASKETASQTRQDEDARERVARQIQVGVEGLLDASESGRAELMTAMVDELLLLRSSDRVVSQIQAFIGNIHSGTLGLTGTVFLIFIAIGLLSNIETTFNDIWGVPHGRSWLARVVQYWATITLGPMLMLLAMGLIIGGKLEAAQEGMLRWLPLIGTTLINATSYLAPFLILTAAFMLIYMLMPNTRVDWQAALIGGLVGGLLWNLNSQFSVLFAAKVVTTSKIYGPLSAVPVFLLGLYLSWLILLFGAQVSYTFQNRRAYLQEKQAETVNQRGREFIALRLITCIGQWFQRGHGPPAFSDITDELGVPTRLAQQVMKTLVNAKLVVEVAGPELAYAPARPLETINCHEVLLAMRANSGQEPAARDEPAHDEVFGEFARIQAAEKQAAAAVTVLALVNRAQARLALASPSAADHEMASTDVATAPPAKPAAAANPSPVPAKNQSDPVTAQASTDDKKTLPL